MLSGYIIQANRGCGASLGRMDALSDTVRVVAVVGAVRQAAGRRRAVAVALGTGAGGRRAIGVVRVATRAGLAAALRRFGAGAGLRPGARTAGRRLAGGRVRVRVLFVGAARLGGRGAVHVVVARR